MSELGNGSRVLLNGESGTIKFIDNPYKNSKGEDVDVLSRVQIDGSENTHGVWCRRSEIKELEEMEEVKEDEKYSKPEITVDSFFAIDMRFCLIESVEDILKKPKKEFDPETNPVKGYKLTIDTGEETRTVVTNIVWIDKKDLIGKTSPFILNFPPATIRGIESNGMIFIANNKLITGGDIGDVVI